MSTVIDNARFSAGLALDALSSALIEVETKILDLGSALAADEGTAATPEMRRLFAGLNDCDAAIAGLRSTLRAMG